MSADRLSRELTMPAASALVVGHVIAVGIFLTPGTMIRTLASPFAVLLIWTGMGAMAICGALCYGALASRYPQTGGGYVYLRESYGPRVAFLYGWMCLWIMDPGITAALATGFASYVAVLVPLGAGALRITAIAAIVAFALVHIMGVRIGAQLINTVSLLKIALIVALTGGAFASPAGSWSHFIPFVERRPGAPAIAGAVAGAFVAAFFSFGGWWEVTRIAGEVRNPQRTLPHALRLGLVTVTLAYVAVTLSFIYLVPIEQVGPGQAFAAQVGNLIAGRHGGTMVALVVIVCVLGSLAALQMVAPRTYVAMADDHVFPAAAAALHPRWGTPARAIATQAVLASVLVTVGTFDTIVAYFVFITVVFIAATVGCVFVIRKHDPTFRVPGYPWTPGAFLGMVALLLALLGVSNPLQAILGLAVVAAAFPVYRIVRPHQRAALKGTIP